MIKTRNVTGIPHAMKIRISSFLILMLFPLAMMGQSTSRAGVSARITSYDRIELIPDSVDLHYRIRGVSDLMMNLTIINASGTSSTAILASPSTDLFLPGRKTKDLVVIFNYY